MTFDNGHSGTYGSNGYGSEFFDATSKRSNKQRLLANLNAKLRLPSIDPKKNRFL